MSVFQGTGRPLARLQKPLPRAAGKQVVAELDVSDVTLDERTGAGIPDSVVEAAAFLKALSHEGRLMILCHLAIRERSVTELEALLGARQAAVSQQLARLRLEGLVSTRREGKAIYYGVSDPRVVQQLRLTQELFGIA